MTIPITYYTPPNTHRAFLSLIILILAASFGFMTWIALRAPRTSVENCDSIITYEDGSKACLMSGAVK